MIDRCHVLRVLNLIKVVSNLSGVISTFIPPWLQWSVYTYIYVHVCSSSFFFFYLLFWSTVLSVCLVHPQASCDWSTNAVIIFQLMNIIDVVILKKRCDPKMRLKPVMGFVSTKVVGILLVYSDYHVLFIFTLRWHLIISFQFRWKLICLWGKCPLIGSIVPWYYCLWSVRGWKSSQWDMRYLNRGQAKWLCSRLAEGLNLKVQIMNTGGGAA